ncbi:hypothetical protein BC830DRAFT_1169830 [Chytriomyces sp. MP71]|nr:hypothetical protein BC830DRAFT_1169830 [Chytriomyces sp. MP71]
MEEAARIFVRSIVHQSVRVIHNGSTVVQRLFTLPNQNFRARRMFSSKEMSQVKDIVLEQLPILPLERAIHAIFTPGGNVVSHILTVPCRSNQNTMYLILRYATALLSPSVAAAMGMVDLFAAMFLFFHITRELSAKLEEMLGKDVTHDLFHEVGPFEWVLTKAHFRSHYKRQFHSLEGRANISPEKSALARQLAPLIHLSERWHFACALAEKSIAGRIQVPDNLTDNWIDSSENIFFLKRSWHLIDKSAFAQASFGEDEQELPFLDWDICGRYPIEAYCLLSHNDRGLGDQFLKSAREVNNWVRAFACFQAIYSSIYAFRDGIPKFNNPDLLPAIYAFCSLLNVMHHLMFLHTKGFKVARVPCDDDFQTALQTNFKNLKLGKGPHTVEAGQRSASEEMPFKGGSTISSKSVGMRLHLDLKLRMVMAQRLPHANTRAWSALTRATIGCVLLQLGLFLVVALLDLWHSGFGNFGKLGNWALVWIFVGAASSIGSLLLHRWMQKLLAAKQFWSGAADSRIVGDVNSYIWISCAMILGMVVVTSLTYPGMWVKCIVMTAEKTGATNGTCIVNVGLS